MKSFNADQIVESIVASKSSRARFDALTHGVALIGLDVVNYGVFGPGVDQLVDSNIQFLTTMRSDWMDYYYNFNLAARDPHVLRLGSGKIAPYIFGESAFDRLDVLERETARQGVEAGLRSTLCVPLTGPGSSLPVGGINLGSSLPEREFSMIMAEHGTSLLSLAHLFHAASIRQVWRDRAGCEPLSARERDCLQCLAAGQRHDAIAHTLGLAKITVEVHLRRARQKLAARTLNEAVAKALLFGDVSYG